MKFKFTIEIEYDYEPSYYPPSWSPQTCLDYEKREIEELMFPEGLVGKIHEIEVKGEMI